MKILFLTEFLLPQCNGMAVHSEKMIVYLRKLGQDLTVFGPKGSPSADYTLPSFNILEFMGALPSFKLLRYVMKEDIDIIQMHYPGALYSFPVYVIAKMRKIKVVCANQGNVQLFLRYWFKNEHVANFFFQLLGFIFYLPQIIFKPTVLQLPGSQDLQTFFKKLPKRLKIRDVVEGVDLDNFSFSPTFKKYHLVYVGRLHPEKNVSRLIYLFSLLPKEYKLTIVGTASAKIEEDLRQYADTFTKDRITIINKIDHENVPRYLREAQAFLTASLFETWGLTLIEALSCGTPIVYPECHVFDTLYGEVFPTTRYSVKDEASFIKAVLDTENQTVERRKQCRAFAAQYSWETVTQQFIDIYQDELAPL